MDLMKRRREILAQGNGLPSAYRRVEYLEGKATEIDTLYAPTISPTAVATFKLLSADDSDLMGLAVSREPAFIIDPAPSSRRWYNRWGSTDPYDPMTSHPPVVGQKQTWEFGRIVKCNGETVLTLEDADWSTNAQHFFLFRARLRHSDVAFYSFKLYDGSYLARNMIPCKRVSDSKAGMYDTVSKQFYTSDVGTLTAGPEI